MIFACSGTVSYCHSGANFAAMWAIQAFISSPGHRNEQRLEQPGPKLHHKWSSKIAWKTYVLLRICWYGVASLISWQQRRKIYLCDFAYVLLLFIDVLLLIWHPASIIRIRIFTCFLMSYSSLDADALSDARPFAYIYILCRIWAHVDKYQPRRKI